MPATDACVEREQHLGVRVREKDMREMQDILSPC